MPYKRWLLSYVESYTGVDWGNSLHEQKADIIADLNITLPVESEKADTVISLNVMEHLREPQVFLAEAYRILKPGGAMILQVPFMWWIHESPYDYYRFTRFGLEYLTRKSGFAYVEVYPMTGFWTTWFLKFNYQSARLIRGPFIARKAVSLLLRSVWAIDQHVALWLDAHWQCEEETAGYFVLALKQ
jgi:SAM-dependent methyltransferase